MSTEYKIGEGRGVFDFEIQGEAIIVDEPCKYLSKASGKIIVTKSPSPAIYLLMKECIGVVSQNGGIVSHLAIIGMDMGVPTMVGVPNLLEKVKNGDIIRLVSINGRGIVYQVK